MAVVEAAVEFADFEMFAADDEAADVIAGLTTFIEMQRHSFYDDGICWVGGHAELVTVSAQGINHQIVRRWNDNIGEPMRPGEPDWSDKRKPAKAALRVVRSRIMRS
jgi:hypothetical protein